MLNRSKVFVQKSTRLAVVAVLLWSGRNAAFSDETVPSSKEEKKERPTTVPEKKNLLNFRAYRPSESIFKSQSIEVPSPSAPTPAPPSARNSKENRELLDRQRNWIFLPGDEKKGDSIDDLLGVNSATLDNESKSVLTRFLENKKPVDATSTKPNAFNRNDSKNFVGPQIFGLGNEKQNGSGSWNQSVTRLENPIGIRGAPVSLAERWQEMHGSGAEKAREDKRVRMNEFENLFSSQSGVGGNNLNTFQSGLGLQPSAPTARGLDSFSRNALSSDPRTPARPLSGANPSTQPSINTRVFGTPSTVTPAPEPPRQVTQPAVLPIPKRRF